MTSDLAEPESGPAAHSMDTTWFAVDGRGHIGVFDSGEGGGVPEAHFTAWHAQSSAEELIELLLVQPAGAGIRFDDEGLFEPQPRRRRNSWEQYEIVGAPEGLSGQVGSVLIELSDPTALADPRLSAALRYEPLVRLPGARPLVSGYFNPDELAARWTELGIVRVRVPYDLEVNRFGLYLYGCDDYSAGPYQREAKPKGPALRLEQLSAPARRKLGHVIFSEVDFSRDRQVQPFEHLPSSAWSEEWLGTDGQMHPVED